MSFLEGSVPLCWWFLKGFLGVPSKDTCTNERVVEKMRKPIVWCHLTGRTCQLVRSCGSAQLVIHVKGTGCTSIYLLSSNSWLGLVVYALALVSHVP